jgi:transcriptional regulator with XRE-family HTH domain
MTPEEFRAARQSLGLEQTQLAELLGFDRAHISRMERAAKPITRVTALAMHALLAGIRLDAPTT